MKCPGFENLIAFLDGQLASDQSESVATHIASGCSRCEQSRAFYEQVSSLAATDDSIEPPVWLTKQAIRLFASKRTQPGLVARLQQTVAALLFDSFAQPQVADVRSSATTNRQLLYRADNYSIDLQILLADQANAGVMGQILHSDDMRFESVANIPVGLAQNQQTILTTLTNEKGEFTLQAVEFGDYDLRFDLPDMSINVSGLSIGELH